MTYWARDEAGATLDWFEFVTPPGNDHDPPGRFIVNVSFLLSTWKCIFGRGCPGILVSGAMEDRGCCQLGVHLGKDEFDRVRGYVRQLKPQDADFFDEIQDNNWFYKEMDPAEREQGYTRHTVVTDGACILANRAGGPAGKVGCALHLLADRLGVHPSETKPDICWQIPIAVTEEYDEVAGTTTVTIDGTPGRNWGSADPDSMRHPGWWCTETPDAYVSDDLLFRTHEHELRKLIGDLPYEILCNHLDGILQTGGRRAPMPGECIHDGQPLIPLMVKKRVAQWSKKTRRKRLERSRQYLSEHPESQPDEMNQRSDVPSTVCERNDPPHPQEQR